MRSSIHCRCPGDELTTGVLSASAWNLVFSFAGALRCLFAYVEI
jgi:hypothetical protein